MNRLSNGLPCLSLNPYEVSLLTRPVFVETLQPVDHALFLEEHCVAVTELANGAAPAKISATPPIQMDRFPEPAARSFALSSPEFIQADYAVVQEDPREQSNPVPSLEEYSHVQPR